MNVRILLRIAGPMFALSLLLLLVGVGAAWNVQVQQQTSSELIAREVHGMLAAEDVFLVMREVRRELDLYLRTHEALHLVNAESFLREAREPVRLAKQLARTEKERELISSMGEGIMGFRTQFASLRELAAAHDVDREFAELNDDYLTNHVLQPIRECIGHFRQVVDRTTAASQATARHMRVGFLLLGLTGSIAGLLSGIAIARTLSRTIVQLDVSIRGVAGKLQEVSGPVHISRFSDLQGIESSVRSLGSDIEEVVERLQQREVELFRSEQLAVVGQLAASMAHELRNPVMPIKVFVQSALQNYPLRPLTDKQLGIILNEITRLEHSIQSLLDFSRPPDPEYVESDVSQVINDTIELVRPKATQQGVVIRAILPAERVLAMADRGQLRQLLLNLILNALDAMPHGGSLEVELIPKAGGGGGPQSNHALNHSAVASPNLLLHIRDSGSGFPADILNRAFEPFVSTKETGAGLGLPICERIVKAHGGRIRALNREVGGAQIEVELPYGHNASLPAQSPPTRPAIITT